MTEQCLNLKVHNRGNHYKLIAGHQHTFFTKNLLCCLYRTTKASELSLKTVRLYLQQFTLKNLTSKQVTKVSVNPSKSTNSGPVQNDRKTQERTRYQRHALHA
ncbi:hypothetical protein [Candidatus Pseudomonas adelgestsugas]|uniref:hypothetical protein n=1 Tax=Candidatus Pseudomonas adelgestsugas TaxID=1302376 RepID=UPI00100F3055|nr:hypothetical protein [Candidatus Pseudomonas adelgestsugas]